MADSALLTEGLRGPYAIIEGDTRRAWITVQSLGGVLTAPDLVTLKVLQPDWSTDEYTDTVMDNPSTGRYEIDLVLTQPGTVTLRWEIEGDVQGVAERRLTVRDSAVV